MRVCIFAERSMTGMGGKPPSSLPESQAKSWEKLFQQNDSLVSDSPDGYGFDQLRWTEFLHGVALMFRSGRRTRG